MKVIISTLKQAAWSNAILVGMLRKATLCLAVTAWLLAADSGAGLRWTVPAGWKAEAGRPMRLATYTITAAAGDHEGAECGVFYFGSGQGGSVEANLDRWIGQFLDAGGKPARAAAKIEKLTVHGVKVTTVDVSGAYTGMGGPTAQSAEPKAGYRLLGAILEGPQGSIFLKFTGPAGTVARNQPDFQKMLASFTPEGGK